MSCVESWSLSWLLFVFLLLICSVHRTHREIKDNTEEKTRFYRDPHLIREWSTSTNVMVVIEHTIPPHLFLLLTSSPLDLLQWKGFCDLILRVYFTTLCRKNNFLSLCLTPLPALESRHIRGEEKSETSWGGAADYDSRWDSQLKGKVQVV